MHALTVYCECSCSKRLLLLAWKFPNIQMCFFSAPTVIMAHFRHRRVWATVFYWPPLPIYKQHKNSQPSQPFEFEERSKKIAFHEVSVGIWLQCGHKVKWFLKKRFLGFRLVIMICLNFSLIKQYFSSAKQSEKKAKILITKCWKKTGEIQIENMICQSEDIEIYCRSHKRTKCQHFYFPYAFAHHSAMNARRKLLTICVNTHSESW